MKLSAGRLKISKGKKEETALYFGVPVTSGQVDARYNDGNVQTQRTMDMEATLTAMRTETQRKPVSVMRDRSRFAIPGVKNEFVREVPKIMLLSVMFFSYLYIRK